MNRLKSGDSCPKDGVVRRLNSHFQFSNLKRKLQLILGVGLLSSQLASADTFINEIHYDNSGSDVGEAVEIAGDAGTDLAGWRIVFYNGNNAQSYGEISLSGVLPNQQDGFGTLDFAFAGIQNGSPDGIALIDAADNVVQFLSYEGAFTATNGPANGVTSTDIGVSELSSTPVGNSLQLSGTGSQASDFSWQEASANTFGSINSGQTFGGGGPQVDVAPEVISTSPLNNNGAIALDRSIDVSFSESVDVIGDWFSIDCSLSGAHTATVSGGPQHYTLDSDIDFSANETCTVTIIGSQISDVDANDPPDSMAQDYSFAFSTQVDSPIRINEIDADTAGSDTLEFIELYDGGIGNTSLDGLVIVLYNGSDNQSYNDAIDLSGMTTNDQGYFVVGNAAVLPEPSLVIDNNSLQNGADAVALYLGNASDYPNDTPLSGAGLIDAVVYDTNDADATVLIDTLTPGQAQLNENASGDKDAHANARVPDGGAAVTTSRFVAQLPTPGTSNVVEAEIFAIQGEGMSSPFEGSYVRTLSNVVTALDTNGFYMQTPSDRTDNDENTSDGIFVFTSSAPTVAVGDLVNVEGNIVEFFGFTEYSGNVSVNVLSGGHSVPTAIQFDDATPSPLQPQMENEVERFEGMLVTFDGIASAATDRFGDTAVVAGNSRAFREPGIEYPGIDGLPVWDGNPEIFELNPDGLLGENLTLFAGQSVSATGPLGFSFGDYQLLPISLEIGEQPDLLAKVRDREAGEMTVGALNLFRLFDDIDDPDADDEVVDPEEYAIRLNKIAGFIIDVMDTPQILAVSEVESLSVLETLANEIETQSNGAVIYQAHLVEGNDVGGIDVGFLTRASVTVENVEQFGKDEILEFDGSLLNDRPPLLLTATDTSDGSEFPIQVLVVHNRSLSGIDDSRRGERVRAKRLAQAQFVAELVQSIQSENPQVNLVVTGDFNAYQFSDGYVDVVGQIAGTSVETDNLLWELSPVLPQLTNQVESLSAEQQYSFVFGGSAQVLDHALTSTNLTPLVSEFSFARGNADVPASLVNDDTSVLRSSDHDGVVLFIKKDSDNDSVSDDRDFCPATSVPETAPTKGLKRNHYALLDGDNIFDTVNSTKQITLDDTAGCSCEQIASKFRIGRGFRKHGCAKGIMKRWVRKVRRHRRMHPPHYGHH